MRDAGDRGAALLRDLANRWEGASYRIAGRTPDSDVDGRTLADRVRSVLGPLEHRLDIPRALVMVEDGVVLLHGEVACASDARQLVAAAQRVAGVVAVESYLHVGLLSAEERPSRGRRHAAPSEAYRRLVAAAVRAGAPEATAALIVRATLAVFSERLPSSTRRQVLAHLPADCRPFLAAPVRTKRPPASRDVTELVLQVLLESDTLSPGPAAQVVAAVIGELRLLVPDEIDDVAAVLPRELQSLWPRFPGRPS